MTKIPSPNRSPIMLTPQHIGGFSIDTCVGKGNFSTVYKAHKSRGKYEVAAIKCVTISSLSATSKDNLINEINILRRVKHEHVVSMRKFTWDARYIYLILEYCPGGNLAEFIAAKGKLPEFIVQHFSQQLVLGLECLQMENIVHCDLKPQNILLSTPPIGSCRNVKLKIADFGFSQRLQSNEKYVSGLKGSPQYMAPEILSMQPYSAQADLYSLGVIIYESLLGSAPYHTKDLNVLYKRILSPDPVTIPRQNIDMSENCYEMLERLLVKDQEKRITFTELYRHSFLDMEHYPSTQNYHKGANIVQQAILLDEAGSLEDARAFYVEGLRFLMPAYHWLDSFSDTQRRLLESRIQEYYERVERLMTPSPSQTPKI